MGKSISLLTLKRVVFGLLALVGANASAALAPGDEPLLPDQVFILKAYAKDAKTVRAEWKILDGYYLYRDKFKFRSKTSGLELGQPVFPKGKVKEDEFFGKVETYRKQVVIDIPLSRKAGSPERLELEVVSQGCADVGLCYPPQTKKVVLDLPPADEVAAGLSSAPVKTTSLLSRLGLQKQQPEFLPAEQVFQFVPEVVDGNTVLARWTIAEGYYLYKDKIKFELLSGDGISLGEPVKPEGKVKTDQSFGRSEVYLHEVAIALPLNRQNSAATDIQLKAYYQGCAEAGFCYPPMDNTVTLSLPVGKTGAGVVPAGLARTGADSAGDAPISEQDSIAKSLGSASLLTVVATFFGFGLLLAFTPCMFPMVPILSSIIVGQGKQLTGRQGFVMSSVYVLAMALTYTVVGVLAALLGQNLQAVFQNPWVLGSFAGVFVLLSFSMFGFYDLQLPNSWQSKLSEISNKQKGGTLAGVAIMGFLSALIVGPCVAAPLAGALIYIGQTGDAVLGGVALFALSVGMGAPLLLIGASAGKLLPKAGAWMDAVKAVFGVMMLAVAIWMLERIIPGEIALVLWAVLLIVSAVYMGALDALHSGASGWRKLWKGVGWVMMVYGALLLIGAATGGSDPLQPLRNITVGGTATAASGEAHFARIKSSADLDRELAAASAAGKPVMLDFYADWCISCKEMERYTFSKPAVQAQLSRAVLLQADVTANDDTDKELMKRFGIIGPPSILFFDRSGTEQKGYRVVGYLEAEKFAAHVQKAFGG